MKPDFEFTEEDSEQLIASFKSVTDGPMADVAAALRSLSHTPTLPAKAKPDVLPSQISIKPSSKFKFFGGGVVTGIATIGAAAGLALGAAAVTGNMPPVISDTAKKMVNVISSVFTSDPVAPTPQTQPAEEVVENVEATNPSQPDVPAPNQNSPVQQAPVVAEKNNEKVAPAPSAAPVAPPKPVQTPLAQISPPVVSQEDDDKESESKSSSQESKEPTSNSESKETTDKKKSESSQLSPITSTQSSSEKKDSEKKSEDKKEEKDDK